MEAVSEPALGSVKATVLRMAPVASPGSQRRFCSSVLWASSSELVIRLRVITLPTLSQPRLSSSATIAMLR
jgi:hypothetical protein